MLSGFTDPAQDKEHDLKCLQFTGHTNALFWYMCDLKTSSLIALASNDTLIEKTVAFLNSIIVSERDTTEESNDSLL